MARSWCFSVVCKNTDWGKQNMYLVFHESRSFKSNTCSPFYDKKSFITQGGYPNHIIALQSCTRCTKKCTNKTNKNGQTWQACQHSKGVQNGQIRCFSPFGTLLGLSGPCWFVEPFQAKNDFLLKSTSAQPYFVLIGQQIDFWLKWPSSVCYVIWHLAIF